jgi:hypothetical protein
MNYKTNIRLVITDHLKRARLAAFLQCLVNADMVKILKDDEESMVVDLLPPRIYETKTSQIQWAQSNADRMRSYGYNTVAAPPWREV